MARPKSVQNNQRERLCGFLTVWSDTHNSTHYLRACVQVVGYRTDPVEPGLLVSNAPGNGSATQERDDTQRFELEFVALSPGEQLRYPLGERHCAGVLTDAGHRPCSASNSPHCREHTNTWVCARCTGDCLKDEMDCYQEHAIYLAAFAPDTFKVGVTRRQRLERRLREQGADRGAHIRTVENGQIAREIEAGIAESIADRVRVHKKRAGLARGVDTAAWEALNGEFDPIDTYEFEYGFDLSERPLAETIATGTVRGVKGRLLVLTNAGSTYAVDMRDLVGHVVEDRASGRNLQSSLGAFE
jgi:hypothetical protein